MANCSFCLRRIGVAEKKYDFPQFKSRFCLDCMACTVCGILATGEVRGIVGMQAFCNPHFLQYKDLLQEPIQNWPVELVDARLNFLQRLKARDEKILVELGKGPDTTGIIADTIALVGGDLLAAGYLKLSERNKNKQAKVTSDRISTDLQECIKQIRDLTNYKLQRLSAQIAVPKEESSSQAPQDPIQTVKLRYAKGEISKTQFDEIMKDLSV